MTVTSVAVATTLLFGMCDCAVENDIGRGDYSLVLGILRVWTQVSAITRVSGHVLENFTQQYNIFDSVSYAIGKADLLREFYQKFNRIYLLVI